MIMRWDDPTHIGTGIYGGPDYLNHTLAKQSHYIMTAATMVASKNCEADDLSRRHHWVLG